jgi:poly(A) polymerase
MDGYGLQTFRELHKYRLVEPLFPDTAMLLNGSDTRALAFIEQALRNTDERVQAGKRVTPAFLFAALLWPAVCERQRELEAMGQPPLSALQSAAGQVVALQLTRIAIPRRFTLPMREIWEMQLRMSNRSAQNAERLLASPKFRASYDFILLREQAGEDLGGLGAWWTEYQLADDDGRLALAKGIESHRPAPARRRRRPRKNTAPIS